MPRIRENSMTTGRLDDGREKPHYAKLTYYTPDGVRRRKFTFFATAAEADAVKAAYDADPQTKTKTTKAADPKVSKTPIGDITSSSTVGDLLDAWLRDVIKDKRDAATYRSYEQNVRVHIKPRIGRLKIGDLRRVKILGLYNALKAEGYGLGVRRHVHSALSSAFGMAASLDILEHNFCEGLGRHLRHTDDAADPEPNPFTPSEMSAFLAYVRKYERPWSEYFQFLFDTGVRVGEAAALKWDVIDVKAKTATIQASYSPSAKGDKDPKTHRTRTIDLTSDWCAQVPAYRKAQREKLMARGRPSVGYVFTTKHGTQRRQNANVRVVFARVLADLADPKWTKAQRDAWFAHTLHSIRDTFATTHLMQNWNKLPWVSQQLGHSRTVTTEKHYFKYKPNAATKQYADEIRTTTTGAK